MNLRAVFYIANLICDYARMIKIKMKVTMNSDNEFQHLNEEISTIIKQ